jgi:hypothetical protein
MSKEFFQQYLQVSKLIFVKYFKFLYPHSFFMPGRSNVKGNDLVSKMDMVADSQTAMSNMFGEELFSYDHISQLVTEYLLTIKEAHR